MCRGTKDYRSSLATVEDYNLTKILANKCSVPDVSGDIKLSLVDFNILEALQMDIEMYNYISQLLSEYWQGKMTLENLYIQQQKIIREEAERLNKLDKSVRNISAGKVQLFQDDAPPGITYYRDNCNLLNNLFVNIVAKSFTNIDEQIQAHLEDREAIRQQEQLTELNKIKGQWENQMMGEVGK